MLITYHDIHATHGFKSRMNNLLRQTKQADATTDVQLIAKDYPTYLQNDLLLSMRKVVFNLSLMELRASTEGVGGSKRAMIPDCTATFHSSTVIMPSEFKSIRLK